jgi:hypothetical protein
VNEHNPLVRMLAAMLLVAVSIRLIYELLKPVASYLLAATLAVGVFRLIAWYQNRL